MGCRGGNRWKIYRIHSFQDKFLLLVSHIPKQILQALHLSVTIFGSCSYGYRKIIVKSYHATVFFLIISHLPPGHPIISSEFKMAAVSVKRSIGLIYSFWKIVCVFHFIFYDVDILSATKRHITILKKKNSNNV